MQINNWHVTVDEIKFLSKRNNFKLLNIDNKKNNFELHGNESCNILPRWNFLKQDYLNLKFSTKKLRYIT